MVGISSIGVYIPRSRLDRAGMPEQDIFSEELMAEIHLRAQGIPRVINAICDNLLLTAFALEQKTCSVDMLDEVCKDMRLDWPGKWLLVRGSNTEPIVRSIAEAPTAAEAERLCNEANAVLGNV